MALVQRQLEFEIGAQKKMPIWQIFVRIADGYNAASPNSVGPSLIRINFGLRACWSLHDGTEGADQLPDREQRLTRDLGFAQQMIEDAWNLKNVSPLLRSQVAMKMIDVAILRNADRTLMETWFQRAMENDPDNFEAVERKAKYLTTVIQDDGAALLEFARECYKGRNFRGRIALFPIYAHAMLAHLREAPAGYYQRPGVWEEIRTTYEQYFRVVPDDIRDRSFYAKLCVYTGNDHDAKEQVAWLGDRADTSVWGGQRGYDLFRLQLARRIASNGKVAEKPVVSPELRKALRENFSYRASLLDSVRKLAGEFPEIPVNTEPGKEKWTRVVLNRSGEKFDCVRFRTPKDKPMDMRWAYVRAVDLPVSWYIGRVDGTPMRGFRSFVMWDAAQIPIARGPGDGGAHTFCMQELPADRLEPDKEYVIWFRAHSFDPVPMSIAINFVLPVDHEPEYKEMLDDLGWAARVKK
jgi:hypothetical protein